MSNQGKRYKVLLTEREMQMVANAVAGFYNVMHREKVRINPEQSALIQNVMERFKRAIQEGSPVKESKIFLL